MNVRVLAASNQPLTSLVENRRFRADLFYRLNNLALTVPPLRDRLDDIPALIVPILTTLRVQMGRDFLDVSPQFRERLRQHWWPGNLRELQHVIAQAALLEDEPLLKGKHFIPVSTAGRKPAGSLSVSFARPWPTSSGKYVGDASGRPCRKRTGTRAELPGSWASAARHSTSGLRSWIRWSKCDEGHGDAARVDSYSLPGIQKGSSLCCLPARVE